MMSDLSIIIPAYNESNQINETVSSLFALKGSHENEFEVIVVDGHPEGTTLSVIIDDRVIRLSGEKGRALQMNTGARTATGDIFLFLHADTMISEDAVRNILSAMKHPEISAGTFHLGIRSNRTIFRLIEKAVFYRTRITRIPYGDQGIFIRRNIFFQLGGYRDIPIMEDVDLMRRLKKNRKKIVLLSQKAYTSSRRWDKEGVICCTLRNWMLILFYFAGIPPSSLNRFYREFRPEAK
ncbi:MAG: TIGR04283 family arsenosugar biosynthesis glycosyltransferase [Thermodesulfobacteriota bacterium]